MGFAVRNYCETHRCGYTHGMGIPVGEMDYLQGDNEMNTFARLTGGRAYFPRFQAELPEIFHDVIGDIRNQYNLAYHPTNPKLDGTYRKLKVEVVAPDGGPLKVKDQKGKDVKYTRRGPRRLHGKTHGGIGHVGGHCCRVSDRTAWASARGQAYRAERATPLPERPPAPFSLPARG